MLEKGKSDFNELRFAWIFPITPVKEKPINLSTFSHIVVKESHDSSLVLHWVEKFIIFEIANLLKRIEE